MNKVYKRLYIVVFLFILILLLNFFSVNFFDKSFSFISNINIKLAENDSVKLASLSIKNYNNQINFNKDITDYNISIYQRAYFLDIIAVAESDSASVTINGND